MAQTSHFNSFGLVCLTTATLAHPVLVINYLRCKLIVSDEKNT